MTPKTAAAPSIVATVQAYIERFVTFYNPDHAFACALWAISTYFHQSFNSFPYLIITAATKRSGKTLLSDIVSFVSSNPLNITGMTAATVYRSISPPVKDDDTIEALVEGALGREAPPFVAPTLFMDEAEDAVGATAKRRAADVMTATLNSGYRKGQTIPRVVGNKLVHFQSYCPKCFILIGDPYDTLRDRSIIVTLQRGQPKARFLYEETKEEGNALGAAVNKLVTDSLHPIREYYKTMARLTFLTARDAEIWSPLFAVCSALAPDRMGALERVAVDMATEKTASARRYINLMGAEDDAEAEEYSARLLRDLLIVIDGAKGIHSAAAIDKLKELPTAPWRKFRGAGLTMNDLANLLTRHGVTPSLVRLGKARTGTTSEQGVARGYLLTDVKAAVKKLG